MSAVDLHLHTKASDGSFKSAELVQAASKLGLEVIAITDHDTVKGVSPAVKTAQEFNIEVIPGIELTTYKDDQRVDVLGYYIDYQNKVLRQAIDKLQNYRRVRAQKILAKLAELGIELEFAKLEKLADDQGIGRPHIARLLVNEGHVSDFQTAFDQYLEDGGSAYVPKYRLTPKKAVEIIKEAGGIPVLAHPGELEDEKLVKKLLKTIEFSGLEAYYSQHTKQATEQYLDWANELDLLVTGGSDCHGPEVESKFLLGTVEVPYQVVDRLKKIKETGLDD